MIGAPEVLILLVAFVVLCLVAGAVALVVIAVRGSGRRVWTRVDVADALAPREVRQAAVVEAATTLRERFGLSQDESLHYAGAVIEQLAGRQARS